MNETIAGQPECAECGGACCQSERLEFPVPEGTMIERDARDGLVDLGCSEGIALAIRVNEHGRTVVRTFCPQIGICDEATRPRACLRFPLNYLDADHSDAERAEIAEFCALFRRLQGEVQT